jgi:hypothetical protein
MNKEELKIVHSLITTDALQEAMKVYCEIYGINKTVRGLSDAIENVSVSSFSDLAEKQETLSNTLYALSNKEKYDDK